jgi:hypothetical protein
MAYSALAKLGCFMAASSLLAGAHAIVACPEKSATP